MNIMGISAISVPMEFFSPYKRIENSYSLCTRLKEKPTERQAGWVLIARRRNQVGCGLHCGKHQD